MHQLSLVNRQTASRNQLIARGTAFGEADRDLVARCGGSGHRGGHWLLGALQALTQLGYLGIRDINTRFEVRQSLQHNIVAGKELAGLRLRGAAPAGEGDRGENKGEQQEHRAAGGEPHFE